MQAAYEWVTSINWNANAVTAAGTVALAVLTLVLAAGTFSLWRATQKLVRSTERTAERQLRAYIFVTGKEGSLPEFSEEHGINVWLLAKNTGQTPAYKVGQWISLDFIADPEVGAFPRPSSEINFVETALGPNSEMTLRAHYPPGASMQQKFSDTQNGSKTICIWGEITYQDAFGCSRYSRFRFKLPVEGGGRIRGIALARGGNEAN